jgi:hypothetical protein
MEEKLVMSDLAYSSATGIARRIRHREISAERLSIIFWRASNPSISASTAS